MISVFDVFQAMAEHLTDSITCRDSAADPADVVEQVEEQCIRMTGYNLNGINVQGA